MKGSVGKILDEVRGGGGGVESEEGVEEGRGKGRMTRSSSVAKRTEAI